MAMTMASGQVALGTHRAELQVPTVNASDKLRIDALLKAQGPFLFRASNRSRHFARCSSRLLAICGALGLSKARKGRNRRTCVASLSCSVQPEAIREAMDFAARVDDGVQPSLWKEADLILLGPSRSGKTTLATFLAKLGLKVANYPLVLGEEPPPELLEIDPNRIVKLTTQADQLKHIREERMRKLGRAGSQYSAMANIRKELSWVKTFYIRNFPRWPMIDTAKAGVAEAAAMIFSQLDTAGVDTEAVSDIGTAVSSLLS